MLKIGNDHFEATHFAPKVDVCERHYVFDAYQPPTSQPLVFNPTANCPAFTVNPKIARPALEKQYADEVEYAQLVKENVSVAPINSGLDGGMNKVFIARFPGRIVPLAIVLPAGSIDLPQLPPIPWTDNDGSLANQFFGALLESNPASQAQFASTDSTMRERGGHSSTAGSTAAPTTERTPVV
jgi:hypothetical protein